MGSVKYVNKEKCNRNGNKVVKEIEMKMKWENLKN